MTTLAPFHTSLSKEERQDLLALLTEFRDVFAWDYSEMPGLANDLVVHNLHVVPGAKTVKQSPRQFRHEIEEQIKQEKKNY